MMYGKKGILTKQITKAGCSGSGKKYMGLNLTAIISASKFKIGETVLIEWKEGEIRIIKYKIKKLGTTRWI